MAKKIDVDLEQIYDLASKGYNTTTICEACGFSRTFAYSHKNITNTIKKGQSQARQSIIDDLFSRSKTDLSATASIFLAKQLKVFDEYFSTATPKTPREALNKIGAIYKAVASNELSAERGDKLIRYLEAYVKAFEVSVIQDELELLKEKFENEFNK